MFKKAKIISLLNLLVLFPGFIYGQENEDKEYLVHGQIFDDENGEPLEYATVTLLNPGDSSMITGQATDQDGRFEIDPGEGEYILKVNYVSYQPKIIGQVILNDNQTEYDAGEISLLPDQQNLDEVIVEGERTEMVMEQDKRVFHIGEDLSSMGATAAELMDNLPGIAVDFEGNVSLRGGNVKILVNGRPSGLVGISSSEALRYFPANQIETVEVITNPSSKYEAEGVGGIINIILKESEEWGLNGNINLQTGIPANHGAAVNLNYRKAWYNIFGSYNIDYRKSPGGGWRYRHFTFPDTSYYMETIRNRTREGLSNQARLGSEFYITDHDILKVSGLIDRDKDNSHSTVTYNDLNSDEEFTRRTIRTEQETEDEGDYEFNLNYEKTFREVDGRREDHELTVDLQYRNNYELEDADLNEKSGIDEENMEIDSYQESINDERAENYLGRADYILPINEEATFEAGLRAEHRSLDNEIVVRERPNEETDWENLSDFSNHFLYDEGVYAAYATFGNNLGKWSYKGGLRLERTEINTYLENTGEHNEQNYTNLFPSASLTYDLGSDNNIQVSHSRRINRPRSYWLNPFRSFQDNRHFRTGNPNLKPEFSGSYEVGYMNNQKNGSLYSGFFYRHTKGERERITTVDEDGITYSMPMNLATQDAYGLELNYSMDLFEWWSLNTNAYFYRSIIEGSHEGEDLSSDGYTMRGRMTSRFDVFDLFKFQVRGYYRAPEREPQERDKAMYVVNMGASKEILNENANISLSIRDVFNTRAYRSVTEGKNFTGESEFRWRNQTQISLSLVYRIKQERKRLEDENAG